MSVLLYLLSETSCILTELFQEKPSVEKASTEATWCGVRVGEGGCHEMDGIIQLKMTRNHHFNIIFIFLWRWRNLESILEKVCGCLWDLIFNKSLKSSVYQVKKRLSLIFQIFKESPRSRLELTAVHVMPRNGPVLRCLSSADCDRSTGRGLARRCGRRRRRRAIRTHRSLCHDPREMETGALEFLNG